MSDTLAAIDEALDVGQRELDCLVAGEVEEAEKLAAERGRLLAMLGAGAAKPELVELLREKLVALQRLQGRLTAEAKKLHAKLREDLLRAKSESRRLSGYRAGARSAPLESRFISKQS